MLDKHNRLLIIGVILLLVNSILFSLPFILSAPDFTFNVGLDFVDITPSSDDKKYNIFRPVVEFSQDQIYIFYRDSFFLTVLNTDMDLQWEYNLTSHVTNLQTTIHLNLLYADDEGAYFTFILEQNTNNQTKYLAYLTKDGVANKWIVTEDLPSSPHLAFPIMGEMDGELYLSYSHYVSFVGANRSDDCVNSLLRVDENTLTEIFTHPITEENTCGRSTYIFSHDQSLFVNFKTLGKSPTRYQYTESDGVQQGGKFDTILTEITERRKEEGVDNIQLKGIIPRDDSIYTIWKESGNAYSYLDLYQGTKFVNRINSSNLSSDNKFIEFVEYNLPKKLMVVDTFNYNQGFSYFFNYEPFSSDISNMTPYMFSYNEGRDTSTLKKFNPPIDPWYVFRFHQFDNTIMYYSITANPNNQSQPQYRLYTKRPKANNFAAQYALTSPWLKFGLPNVVILLVIGSVYAIRYFRDEYDVGELYPEM